MSFQVNAATAAITALHCVICFDEFNLQDQPPVVLPCGHTYVCAPCSKRIKVCMECREPLFWTPPRAAPLPRHVQQRQPQRGFNPTRYNSLDSAAPSSKFPVKEVTEPIPLPLPRNLVLLAIMEAAERAVKLHRDMSMEDEEDELNHILLSLENLSGPYGTYAVKDKEGLAVLPLDPRKRNSLQDVSTQTSELKEPYSIQWGQTVQISDVQDGVYKLARGSGYIVAGDSQLVKIGGPLDKSCELEGMHEMMEQRRQELQRQLKQVERLSTGLLDRILYEQQREPTHPILTLAPSATISEDQVIEPSSPDRHVITAAWSSPATPGQESVTGSILKSGTPHTIDNSDLTLSAYVDENKRPQSVEFSCGVSFPFGEDDAPYVRSFDSIEASPRATRREPAAMTHSLEQLDLGGTSESSYDTVDFRTGRSGHLGLGSSQTADRRGNSTSRGQIRMMGEHRGIGPWVTTPFSLSAMLGSLHSHEETGNGTPTTQGRKNGSKRTPPTMVHPI